MSQVGLNLGPRHARVLGFAKSYTAKLDDMQIQQHDEDAIGAASITWGLIQAAMLSEVIDPVNQELAAAELPRLATRNIKPGTVLRCQNTYLKLTILFEVPAIHLVQDQNTLYFQWRNVRHQKYILL